MSPLRSLRAVLPALAVLGAALPAGAAQPPAVGSKAPAFTLNSQEGKPVSLSDYKGKWVVLYFYPKDFTSGCTLEAHRFQKDIKEYEKRGAVILGVSVQSAGSHKDFCAKEGLNFKLLADTDRKVSEAYGSLMNLLVAKLSSRHTFLIDPGGVVAKAYLDVDPDKHSRDLLADLDRLQAVQAGPKP